MSGDAVREHPGRKKGKIKRTSLTPKLKIRTERLEGRGGSKGYLGEKKTEGHGSRSSGTFKVKWRAKERPLSFRGVMKREEVRVTLICRKLAGPPKQGRKKK